MSNSIRIKPQWLFRMIDGVPYLTSEVHHRAMKPEHAAFLSKLAIGVEADTLTDLEFDQMEELNGSGYITTLDENDAATWEQSFLLYKTVQEQFAHTTFVVMDLTKNLLGTIIEHKLLANGMAKAESDTKPRLTIVVADSYLDIPQAVNGPMLPLVLNRTRISAGPLQFPWSQPIAEQVQSNANYLPELGYRLPPAFHEMQIAWAVLTVLRFVAMTSNTLVNSIVELDMVKNSLQRWPV